MKEHAAAQVLDLAAVSDVCKLFTGLADVCKIEPEGENSALC